MAVDVLAPCVARASAIMMFIMLTRINSVPVLSGLSTATHPGIPSGHNGGAIKSFYRGACSASYAHTHTHTHTNTHTHIIYTYMLCWCTSIYFFAPAEIFSTLFELMHDSFSAPFNTCLIGCDTNTCLIGWHQYFSNKLNSIACRYSDKDLLTRISSKQ